MTAASWETGEMNDVSIWAEIFLLFFSVVISYRISVGSSTEDIIGTCLNCGDPFDDYSSRCRCKYCRMLVLVCDNCQVCYNSNLFSLNHIWLAVPLFNDFLATAWIQRFTFRISLSSYFWSHLAFLWFVQSCFCYLLSRLRRRTPFMFVSSAGRTARMAGRFHNSRAQSWK